MIRILKQTPTHTHNWRGFGHETRRTVRDVFFLVAIAVYALFGNPALVQALDQEFLSSNNAPFFGPDICQAPASNNGQAVQTLTKEQQIAQTFIVGFSPNATAEVSAAVGKYKLGGVFPVGDGDNSRLTKAFFDELSTKAGAQLFIAADDEGGQVARFTKGIIPSADEMGRMTAEQAKVKGQEAGAILKNNGLTGDLAPVLDIATPGTPWTATQRDWAANPDAVVSHAGGWAAGLSSAGIIPVYKHFPGIGRVTENTDFKKTTPLKLSELKSKGDLKPFERLINQHSGAVMLSNAYVEDWGDIPVGINKKAVDYLRIDMQFTGVIMTDALNALSQDGYGNSKVDLSTAVAAALNAGVDMPLFIPSNMDGDIDAAIKKVAADVSDARVTEAYRQSLKLRGIDAQTAASASGTATVTCCSTNGPAPVGTTPLTGKDNTEKVMSYLLAKGLQLVTVVAIIASLKEESGPNIQPNIQQTSRSWPTGGWGIAQWTADRRPKVVDWVTKDGLGNLYDPSVPQLSPDENDKLLASQLNFLWNEFETSEKKSLDATKAVTDPGEAARVFERTFERCSPYNGEAACGIPRRMQVARDLYAQYADAAPMAGSGSSAATPTPTTGSATAGTGQTVVALDPGHGATVAEYNFNGLVDRETDNGEETRDVLDVANQVKTQLEAAGYRVVLLRDSNEAAVSKKSRVEKAVAEKANIGVSIHTDMGLNEVWSQKVDAYREYNGTRVTFSNGDTAKKSQAYADAFKTTREAAEGRTVNRDPDNSSQAASFGAGRDDVKTKGNIPLMMLWSESVPWVYNEMARGEPRSLSADLKQKYVTGIVEGVKKAIPANAGTDTSAANCASGSGTGATGGFADTVKRYVLPQYMGDPYIGRDKAMPDYAAGADKATSEGRYVGAGGTHCVGGAGYSCGAPTYADCGGFVTTIIVDSGHDPTYNTAATGGGGPTGTQRIWLEKNWTPVFSSKAEIDEAKLLPGDVLIEQGHTFLYIGPGTGVDGTIASASYNGRVPMSGKEKVTGTDSSSMWYRKK